MKKLNANELKERLLNEEISFFELDDLMKSNGYLTVFNDGVTKDIKESQNVVYTAKDTCEAEIMIDFEITINNGKDEIEESFYLKVLNVSAF